MYFLLLFLNIYKTLRLCLLCNRAQGGTVEMRKVAVPAHRYTPLKENWMKIYTPIVENLQLQVRFNLKTRNVEIKVSVDQSLASNSCLNVIFYDVLWLTVMSLFVYRHVKKHRTLVPLQRQQTL